MPDISVLSGTHPTTIFLICFFLHIVADFNLQGMLKDLKQKSWWEKNYERERESPIPSGLG